jgi:tetratricopeptide (TPR) repeat protein
VIARGSSFAYKGRSVDPCQIGRELNVRYLLDGSVRKARGRVRISVQLIEAESGAHVWADRFDGALKDVFDLQDRITASVVGAIEPSLRGAEIERARRKPPDDLNAYDHYLRALSHAYGYTRQGRALALSHLGKALSIDPRYAEAHGLAAWCHIQRIHAEAPESSADLASALTHAKAVMTLRTDDASALAFAAQAYVWATRDYDTAIQTIEQALARNPSNAHALAMGAVVNAWAGRYDTAGELAERALRCSPFDPIRHLAHIAIARARLFQGDAEAALEAARRAVSANPAHSTSHGYILICLVRLGRVGDLQAAVERVIASFPGVRLVSFTGQWSFEPFIAELKAAGLPP